MFLKLVVCLLLQKVNLLHKAWQMALIRIVSELLLCKSLTRRTGRKPSKQECKSGQAKESIHRLFAILVHRLSHGVKVYQWIFHIVVIFVVTMGQNKHFQELNEFKVCFFIEPVEQPRELLLDKGNERIHNRAALLVRLPLVKERLVGKLVVQSHCPEAWAFEKEVKILVIVFVTFFWPLFDRIFCNFFFAVLIRSCFWNWLECYDIGTLFRLLALNG